MAVFQKTNDLQSSYEIGKQEGLEIAKLDKFKATQDWVNKWRQDNGVGPNVTPSKDVVPFKWMHPFLHKVQTDSLQIAGGMPPDLNTPWLPGGQKTDGIPNITNPKLKKKLQQKKGIKGTDAELFPLAQISPTDTPRDLKIQDVIKKYGKDEKGKYKNPELLIRNLPRA